MSIYVTADMAKINIQYSLNDSVNSYQKTLEKLSSGYKYTSTSDNPIGISQAVKMTVQTSATREAISNVNTGQSLLSTAGSGQEEVIQNLQRIRDLCTQAENGTYSASDKDAILADIRSELQNIDSIAEATNFDGIKLLNGNSSNLKLQIGINSTSTMEVGEALIDVHCSQIGGDIRIPNTTTGENWTDISGYVEKIDSAISTLIQKDSIIGGYQARMENSLNNLDTSKTNLTRGKSVILDADIAEESANIVKYQILQQSSASILTQANQSSSFVLNLLNI